MLLLVGGTRCWPARRITLPALAWSVFAAPVVDVLNRLEKLLVVATVRHARIEVARPLPVVMRKSSRLK